MAGLFDTGPAGDDFFRAHFGVDGFEGVGEAI